MCYFNHKLYLSGIAILLSTSCNISIFSNTIVVIDYGRGPL